jgi:Arc/MetJ family transcription regulator
MPRVARHTGPLRQRKTLDLDQHLLDQARRTLGAATETDTVRIALERVVRNKRIADGIRSLGGIGINLRRINE